MLTRLLLCSLLITFSSLLPAHELGIAKLDIEWKSDQRLEIRANLSDQIILPSPIMPAACALIDNGSIDRPNTNAQQYWQWHCSPDEVSTTALVKFEWPMEGLLINRSNTTAIDAEQFYDADEGVIEAPLLAPTSSSNSLLAQRYSALGVKHILMGWDHLAFVFGLFLLASGIQLIKLITAFTVGHTLTLGLAAMGIVSLPVAPTEACIALSIAWVARQIMMGDSERHHQGIGVVLLFGLLHGLGFASALSSVGLHYDNLMLALIFFNIGVEIGQLLFVACLLGLALLSNYTNVIQGWRSVATFGLGVLGTFWTIERVIGFWGG